MIAITGYKHLMAGFVQWLIWISFPLSIFYFLHILKILRSSSNHANLPPGPKPLPIFGNMFMLGDQPHRSLARLAKTYGPVMALKLGQVTTIVISSPDVAREVLMKKDQAFCGRSVPDAACALDHHHVAREATTNKESTNRDRYSRRCTHTTRIEKQ